MENLPNVLPILLIGAIILTPFGIREIPEINLNIAYLLVISAVASALGNLIIIEANRRLPANVVAPFVYTQLIAATLLSVIVFDSWPDMISLIGLMVLFISGILSFIYANQQTTNERMGESGNRED